MTEKLQKNLVLDEKSLSKYPRQLLSVDFPFLVSQGDLILSLSSILILLALSQLTLELYRWLQTQSATVAGWPTCLHAPIS